MMLMLKIFDVIENENVFYKRNELESHFWRCLTEAYQ